MSDPLLRYRSEFPILETCTYLVSHSLGALPARGRAGLNHFAREWDELGVRAWRESWWNLGSELGDRVAGLLGASPGTVVMQPNVTLASAVFLSSVDFSPERPKLVTTELDFPSLLYLYDRAPFPNMEVVRVPSDDGLQIDPGRLLDAIDTRTRVVAICHVLFRSAAIQDVRAVVEKAHRVGALV
ncbi:MAG: aminotransferase class V-fold PLP-dependent enzyme, partial [Candidatus Eisenbacteria bacterium]|nr:aminotransferase class V-fold PLP-dependent enzyme [Candidatus Eisenbacteria bacterium]